MVEALRATAHRLLLLTAVWLPSLAFAHRLDECLQSTIVTIEPAAIRLQIEVMPGVAVAKQVLAQIDRDHDDVISAKEAAAYTELLKRDLAVVLDKNSAALSLTGSDFPAVAEFRTGMGIIKVEFSVKLVSLAAGAHTLRIENRHLANMSVYLVNAALPKSRSVKIIRQDRNDNQSVSEIHFTL